LHIADLIQSYPKVAGVKSNP